MLANNRFAPTSTPSTPSARAAKVRRRPMSPRPRPNKPPLPIAPPLPVPLVELGGAGTLKLEVAVSLQPVDVATFVRIFHEAWRKIPLEDRRALAVQWERSWSRRRDDGYTSPDPLIRIVPDEAVDNDAAYEQNGRLILLRLRMTQQHPEPLREAIARGFAFTLRSVARSDLYEHMVNDALEAWEQQHPVAPDMLNETQETQETRTQNAREARKQNALDRKYERYQRQLERKYLRREEAEMRKILRRWGLLAPQAPGSARVRKPLRGGAT